MDELKDLVERIGEAKDSDSNPITMPLDAQSNTVLHYASKKGNVDAVRIFLDNLGEDASAIRMINTKGDTPLSLAKKGKHTKLVQLYSNRLRSAGPGNG